MRSCCYWILCFSVSTSLAAMAATDRNLGMKKKNMMATKAGKGSGSGKGKGGGKGTGKGVTYAPGDFSWGTYIRDKNGDRIRVANGVYGRPIAYQGDPIVFADGSESSMPLHERNDGGGVFEKDDGSGFYYVSNSEAGDPDDKVGGVYSIELNEHHEPVDYYPILTGTVDNCAGGKTPWGTWVSCEEEDGYGQCWQTDPEGIIPAEPTVVTGYIGNWEAFAWDDHDYPPKGYTTDDAEPEDAPESYGALARFTPDKEAMKCYNRETKAQRWCTLNSGTVDYLVLHPHKTGSNCGTISWTPNPQDSSAGMYRKGEGIDITHRIMRFAAKEDRLFFVVDLEEETYCQSSTYEGFAQEPDNLRFLGDTTYFCTDGRTPNGIYGYDGTGYFGIVMEMDYNTEAAGVDFSPDRKWMYMSFQNVAIWQFWRVDGYPWDAPNAGVKYGKDVGAPYDNGDILETIITDVAEEVLEDQGLI